MTRSITSLVVLLAIVIALSGCANNDQKQKQPNQDPNKQTKTSTSTTPTSTQATTTFNLKNIEKWKKFNEKDFNFTFYYPANWSYKLRQFDTDLAKANFSSSWKSKIMITENRNSPIGMEIYDLLKVEVREIKSADTDLVVSYFKLNKEISGINKDLKVVMIQWKKGKNFNRKKLQKIPKNLTSTNNNSGRIFLTKHSSKYSHYYNSIIDKIVSSFNFK